MSFTCPQCKLTSHNPNDEASLYCANCGKFFTFHKVSPGNRKPFEGNLHHNFESHYSSWRQMLSTLISLTQAGALGRAACERMGDARSDGLYYLHELQAFDDAYTADGKPAQEWEKELKPEQPTMGPFYAVTFTPKSATGFSAEITIKLAAAPGPAGREDAKTHARTALILLLGFDREHEKKREELRNNLKGKELLQAFKNEANNVKERFEEFEKLLDSEFIIQEVKCLG